MNYFYALLVGAYLALVNSRSSDLSLHKIEWEAFRQEYGREYESPRVESMRRTLFTYNKHVVDTFNNVSAPELGFELGLNHLADVSEVEMKFRNGYKSSGSSNVNTPEAQKFLDDILNDDTTEVPDEVDWRKEPGRVSRVKNQGSCGSCWAFASTGALEGQEKVRSNLKNFGASDLVELSEQNLVDCVTDDYGCNGGDMEDAFKFIKKEQGIDSEQSYPYQARTMRCRFKKDKVAFTDSGAAILPEGDEQKLKEVVAKFGPVAVAIDASSIWFQFYRHGVYYNKHCRSKKDQLDHGVLVVGYGTDPKKGDYWIVKNSWGLAFGESGYIRMARNRENNCGIATAATIPTF